MFGLSNRNKYSGIALDMGADSVKLLQLEWRNNKPAVHACGRWKFPSGSLLDWKTRLEMAVDPIRAILNEADFRGKKVYSVIPSSQLSIKNIRLPHMSRAELREAIRWEAQERFNFEVNPEYLKYFRAGEVRQGAETQQEILLLAAKEGVVEAHLEMLSALGLSPERIDAEPVACFRAFDRWLRRDSDENTVSVILDIGYEASRILVAKGREILFIKVIDIGGRRLTETASKQLNMSFEEATELRNLITRENAEESDPELDPKGSSAEGAGSVSWTIHDAVRGEIEALAREVSLCLRYCAVTFRGLRPQKVTVVGGQAYDPSVVKLLSEDLNIECVIGQPLRGVDVSHACFGGNRRGMLAEWSVCMGLACKSIEKQKSKVGAYNEYHRLPA